MVYNLRFTRSPVTGILVLKKGPKTNFAGKNGPTLKILGPSPNNVKGTPNVLDLIKQAYTIYNSYCINDVYTNAMGVWVTQAKQLVAGGTLDPICHIVPASST